MLISPAAAIRSSRHALLVRAAAAHISTRYCIVVVVVVVAQSTSAKQTLSRWGLTIVCEPIHLGEVITAKRPTHSSVRDRTHNLSPEESVR